MKKLKTIISLTILFALTACVETQFADVELDEKQEQIAEQFFDGNLPSAVSEEEVAESTSTDEPELPAQEAPAIAEEDPQPVQTTTSSSTESSEEEKITTTTKTTQTESAVITETVVETENKTTEEKEAATVKSFCASNKYAVDYAERDILALPSKGKGSKKFLMCHFRSENAKNPWGYIEIAEAAIAHHTAHHGDYLIDSNILQELPKGSSIEDFNCECP